MSLVRRFKSPPDIVVALTTQWRAQALGYAGDPNATTPHLDRLAEASIDCFQAVTPHPFGVFARAAFFTGQPCPENGISDYYDPLPADAITLAHRFSNLGYKTSFFGKWQLFKRDPNMPVVGEGHARVRVMESWRGGFDFWEGFEGGFLLNDCYFHGTRIAEPTIFKGYQSDVIVDRFIEYSRESETTSPRFSILSFDAPHPPYDAPASGAQSVDTKSVLLNDEVVENENIRTTARREMSGYYRHIEATDTAIGRLISFLKTRDWSNTLFVFTSVHGDMHGSCGLFRKGWPHEESVRVPMLFSWPRVFDVPRRDPILISLLDLGPTLLGLASGVEWPQQGNAMKGRDLSQALLLKSEGPDEQCISMPSIPPFEKQCPYVWKAKRSVEKTVVLPEKEKSFTLDH